MPVSAAISACIVAASEGYPGTYTAGKKISGLDAAGEVAQVFHAGTTLINGEYLTSGGRVLGVAAAAESLEQALGIPVIDPTQAAVTMALGTVQFSQH